MMTSLKKINAFLLKDGWLLGGGVNKEGFLLRERVVGWKYFRITDLVIKIQAGTDKD